MPGGEPFEVTVEQVPRNAVNEGFKAQASVFRQLITS